MSSQAASATLENRRYNLSSVAIGSVTNYAMDKMTRYANDNFTPFTSKSRFDAASYANNFLRSSAANVVKETLEAKIYNRQIDFAAIASSSLQNGFVGITQQFSEELQWNAANAFAPDGQAANDSGDKQLFASNKKPNEQRNYQLGFDLNDPQVKELRAMDIPEKDIQAYLEHDAEQQGKIADRQSATDSDETDHWTWSDAGRPNGVNRIEIHMSGDEQNITLPEPQLQTFDIPDVAMPEFAVEGQSSITHRVKTDEYGIDFGFITRRERKDTQAYWPENQMKSGATISIGFDLGQRNARDLQRLGLSQELQQRFAPFLGVKGRAADLLLKSQAKPLEITPEESTEIVGAVKREIFGNVIRPYDAVSPVKFADLSVAQRTVIGSMAWQYGANLSKETPNFWKQTTSQDWQGALKNLRDFRDAYPTRRKLEADYLERSFNP